jgi:hypothetical protein
MSLRKEFLITLIILASVFYVSFFELGPLKRMMDWKSARNALAESEINFLDYQLYDHTDGNEPEITVDFLKGKHFWNPQVVIWLEDSTGTYLETLLVTTSTARGLFYSGRSASNFKESDEAKKEEHSTTRRVDALPYWSHKRGHQYPDGFYSPPPSQPLPDAITGATAKENFYFQSSSSVIRDLNTFRILLEVYVAFDENEFYSEYDFPEDSLYHNGTGLLGQPSLIYSTTIKKTDKQRYYVMSLIGHGHHAGASGELFPDISTISTAKYIAERIVVGINESWYVSRSGPGK